jgi:hypothetical protein
MVVSPKKRKEKIMTCVLIINHLSLNEDELELGLEVCKSYFVNVGQVFNFINKYRLARSRGNLKLHLLVL